MMAFILQVSMHAVLSLSSDFLYNLALKLGFFTCFLQLLNNIRVNITLLNILVTLLLFLYTTTGSTVPNVIPIAVASSKC